MINSLLEYLYFYQSYVTDICIQTTLSLMIDVSMYDDWSSSHIENNNNKKRKFLKVQEKIGSWVASISPSKIQVKTVYLQDFPIKYIIFWKLILLHGFKPYIWFGSFSVEKYGILLQYESFFSFQCKVDRSLKGYKSAKNFNSVFTQKINSFFSLSET